MALLDSVFPEAFITTRIHSTAIKDSLPMLFVIEPAADVPLPSIEIVDTVALLEPIDHLTFVLVSVVVHFLITIAIHSYVTEIAGIQSGLKVYLACRCEHHDIFRQFYCTLLFSEFSPDVTEELSCEFEVGPSLLIGQTSCEHHLLVGASGNHC